MHGNEVLTFIREEGFHTPRIAWGKDLLSSLPPSLRTYGQLDSLLEPRYSLITIAALPLPSVREEEHLQEHPALMSGELRDRKYPAPGRSPALGYIAPFARYNYYREAVQRLKRVARRIHEETGVTKQEIRIFVNSPLPEKAIAYTLGLGFIGKNSLVITPSLGSRFLLAGMTIGQEKSLIDTLPAPLAPHASQCAECRSCIENCPTGALLNPGRCIQWFASRAVSVPDSIKKTWGARIYGCVSCQTVCPFNAHNQKGVSTELGAVGPAVDLHSLLASDETELGKQLKPTALGMSWIDPRALKRNAMLAAGNQGIRELEPQLREYLCRPDKVLQETARWALTALHQVGAD